MSTACTKVVVLIRITRNPNQPVFKNTPYKATVPDNQQLSTSILQVTATDADGDKVEYYISSVSDATTFFNVDRSSGIITAIKSLKETNQNQYDFKVTASDQKSPEKSATADVTIIITRTPAGIPPQFDTSPCSANLKSTQATGVSILQIAATDADIKAPAKLQYELTGVYPSPTFFDVNIDTGVVTVKTSLTLDSLKTAKYTLTFKAYDNTIPAETAVKTCTVDVTRNPNAPVFSRPDKNYAVTILSSHSGGVITVPATDADNDILKYTMVSLDGAMPGSYFEINERSGLVSVRKPLTQTTRTTYKFQVTVSDQQVPAKTDMATLTITVTFTTEKHNIVWTIPPADHTISENKPVNDLLMKVEATDKPSAPGQVKYTIKGFEPGPDFFQIDENSGAISIKKALTSDINALYTLLVAAYSTDEPTTSEISRTMTVRVTRNEGIPKFQLLPYNVTIPETQPLGSSIFQVTATDSDKGRSGEIFYIGSVPGNFFNINPSTGVIAVNTDLLSDKQNQYFYRVVASDRGVTPNLVTATVTVSVLRNLFAPVLGKTSYEETIPDTYALGKAIITVTATDQDHQKPPFKDAPIFYMIEPNNVQDAATIAKFFQISSNGDISLSNSLINENAPNYRFRVIAYDGTKEKPALRSNPSQVTIFIKKGAGDPIISPLTYYLEKRIETPLNTEIIDLDARSPANNPLTYQIVGDGIAPDMFGINQATGLITLKKSFTSTSTMFYSISVLIYETDHNLRRVGARVTVKVLKDEIDPVFRQKDYYVTIYEDHKLDTSIIQVEAFNKPTNKTHPSITYSVNSVNSVPTNVENWFFINPTTGVIYVKAPLATDGTKRNIYKEAIVASADGRQDNAMVHITVLRNPNQCAFSKRVYDQTVKETIKKDTELVTAGATDADSGDTLTYSLSGPTATLFYFAVDSSNGKITIKNELLNGQEYEYSFQVIAADNGKPSKSCQATVNVVVTGNEFSPVFAKNNYTVTISELSRVGTSVIAIPATDKDDPNTPSGTITYSTTSCPVTPDARTFFQITTTSGLIQVVSPLTQDIGKRTYFCLTVRATDGGRVRRSAEATVYIFVIRNEYDPAFSPVNYAATVLDTIKFGVTIIDVNATDRDVIRQPNTANSNVRYSIEPTNSRVNRFFVISPVDGLISVKVPLTNDNNLDPYRFIVYACDQGTPNRCGQANCVISVTRTTQTGGVLGFILRHYTTVVLENTPPGTNILDLDAIYQDQDLFVTCSFVEGFNMQGVFLLKQSADGKNCILVTGKELDREVKDKYNFLVEIEHTKVRTKRDAREAVLSRHRRQSYRSFRVTNVTVIVGDVNDNAPKFIFPLYPDSVQTRNKYFGAISGTANPYNRVIQATATDADLDANAKIRFLLGDPNEATPRNPPFMIDPDNGNLYNLIEFTSDSTPKYRFDFSAIDLPADPRDSLRTNTEAIINLIYNPHRMILVIPDNKPRDVIPNLEAIRRKLQEVAGTDCRIVIFEKIEDRRTIEAGKIIKQPEGTDIWFVTVNTKSFDICKRTDVNANFMAAAAQSQIIASMRGIVAVERIRPPFGIDGTANLAYTKTYYYYDHGDAFSALIALACIIILLCIIGIVVVLFSWGRYVRYRHVDVFGVMHHIEPVFLTPPSILDETIKGGKQFETQSIEMYVGPEDKPLTQHEIEVDVTEKLNSTSQNVHMDGTGVVNPVYALGAAGALNSQSHNGAATGASYSATSHSYSSGATGGGATGAAYSATSQSYSGGATGGTTTQIVKETVTTTTMQEVSTPQITVAEFHSS